MSLPTRNKDPIGASAPPLSQVPNPTLDDDANSSDGEQDQDADLRIADDNAGTASKEKSHNPYKPTRYHPPGKPFICALCKVRFMQLGSVKVHFDQCKVAHPEAALGIQWDAHDSCMTKKRALGMFPIAARPLYPEFYTRRPSAGGTIVEQSIWTNTGWPLDLQQLERKNEAHLATPGANPYYVDTRENVYADVDEDDQHSHGERPDLQLQSLIQALTWMEVSHMLRTAEASERCWEHPTDGVLALGLHKSDSQAARLLELEVEDFQKWLQASRDAFFEEHVRMSSGPNDPGRVVVPDQRREFAELVIAFRARHKAANSLDFGTRSCCLDDLIEVAFREVKPG